jgi:response regulator NasT
MHVLLADTDAERAATVELALFEAGAQTVMRPTPGESLYEAVARLRPDVVLVDMQRPDRDALDDVRHLTAQDPRPIVMFIDCNDPDFMHEAIAAGVSSYNVLGAQLPDIKPIIAAAIAMFARFRQLQEELRRVEASLEERTLIDRAKALLMRTRRIPEPDAYRWLRRQAMDQGRRIADIAAELLEQAGAR